MLLTMRSFHERVLLMKDFIFRARTLEYVETYLNSPYSLDAWILLSMVASNIKSKTPQFVYFKLQDNLCDFVSIPIQSIVAAETFCACDFWFFSFL